MNTVFVYLIDIMSNISLTIGCVLLLSYMREVPPDLSINSKLFKAFSLQIVGAFPQRFLANYIMPNRLPYFEDSFKVLVNYIFNKEWGYTLDTKQVLSLTLTAVVNLWAAILICIGAYIIMENKSIRHMVPMLLFQFTGLAFRFLMQIPYQMFINNTNIDITEYGYNGFAYGVFMLIAIIIYINCSQRKFLTLSSGAYIFSLGFFFIIYSVISHLNTGSNSHVIRICILLLFIGFIVVAPWYSYKIMQIRIQDEQKEKEQKADAKNYKKDKELNIFNHDLSKHLQLIEDSALKEGAHNTANMAHSLLDRYLIVRMGFCTGNSYLDRELSNKKKEVENYGINITFEGIFPENGIDEIDICTIMNNALENAVTACMSVGKTREIAIRSGVENDYVYVKITNPYNKDKINVDKKTGKLRSTKPINGGIHGYGISSIENTVQKYNGTAEISYDGKIFTLRFKMKYK